MMHKHNENETAFFSERKLYTKSTKGILQEWIIEVSNGRYRTISGQVGGKLTTSKWTQVKGKNIGKANETTTREQAILEANSKIEKQKDKGYNEDIGLAGRKSFIAPMLAHKFKFFNKMTTKRLYVQPKLDGARFITTAEAITSRNGKRFLSTPHIQEDVKQFLEDNPEFTFLDGEAYNHELKDNFNKIISLIKKTKPTQEDLDESKDKIKYYVYDCGLEGKTFGERHEALKAIDFSKYPSFELVETHVIENTWDSDEKIANLDELYKHWLELGYEGQMLRGDTIYEHKRSYGLIKRKEFKEEEFLVLYLTEGKGDKAGTAASATCITKDGKEFNTNIMGTDEIRAEMLAAKDELQNKLATVQFFEYTPDGIPRFGYLKEFRTYE